MAIEVVEFGSFATITRRIPTMRDIDDSKRKEARRYREWASDYISKAIKCIDGMNEIVPDECFLDGDYELLVKAIDNLGEVAESLFTIDLTRKGNSDDT